MLLERHEIDRAKELWEANEHLKKMDDLNVSISYYAKRNKLDYKRFCKMNYLIRYKAKTQPHWYQDYVLYTQLADESRLTTVDFCAENNLKPAHIGETKGHLKALELIEKYENYINANNEKKDDEPKSLGFISVPQSATRRISLDKPEPEVITKKNDIELNITKGVKVIVSPDFPSDKFIKIIELLKDL